MNLLSSSSAESKNGTRSNLLSFHAGKTTKQLIGFNGHTLYIDERDAIRRRTKNILDDLESQSKGSSKDFVEVQWDEQSTKSLSINIEKTSSEESLARKRKRKLEKKLQESKRKAACQAMQTLLENEEWKEGSRRACLSMKEFIVHSSSFDDEFQKRGWQEHPSRSYSSQFLSINPSESNQYSPAQPSPKMSEFELFEMAQRVPVAGTPENTAKKVYNRMSDISGTIVEEPNVEAAYSEETENAQEEVVNANSMTRKKQRRSSGWFRKVMTPEKPQFKDNSERAPNSRGRTFGLFGRNNRPRAWDQNSDSCPLSPSKRYRRGGRGQLVPRRLARGQPDDENSLASHIDSTDDENYEHFGNILIGGARGSPRGEGLCSPDVLGIAAEKQRPPMLDLKDLEEADHSENDEDVECPLVTHPPPSSQELHMTYGRDLLYGQDPDGFELTTHNRRNRTINTGSRVPGLMSQSSSQSDDPPTASEHRRIISARRKARRSALRKKDSPRRVEAERVTFYKKTIEFPVNEDSIILGSIDTNDSELELEWGNMI